MPGQAERYQRQRHGQAPQAAGQQPGSSLAAHAARLGGGQWQHPGRTPWLIEALPGDSPDAIRGFSGPAAVVVDECAFMDDGLLTAVMPALAASSGRLAILSTPNGKRAAFKEIVTAAHPIGISSASPRRSAHSSRPTPSGNSLASAALMACAEFACELVDGLQQYFADEAITSILSASLPLLNIIF